MNKKVLALLMTAVLTIAMSVPCFAGTKTTSEAGDNNVEVTATVGSTYTVELPDAITLCDNDSNGTYDGTYSVGVKGNILNTQEVTVTPITPFTMTNADDNSVTASAAAPQGKNSWRKTVANAATQVVINKDTYTTTGGSISVSLTTAGTYSGTIVYTVALGND